MAFLRQGAPCLEVMSACISGDGEEPPLNALDETGMFLPWGGNQRSCSPYPIEAASWSCMGLAAGCGLPLCVAPCV